MLHVCFVTHKRFSFPFLTYKIEKENVWNGKKCNPLIYRFTFWAYLSQEIHNCLFDRDVVNSTSSDSNPPLSKQLMSELRPRDGFGLNFLRLGSLWDKIWTNLKFWELLEPKLFSLILFKCGLHMPEIGWNGSQPKSISIELRTMDRSASMVTENVSLTMTNEAKDTQGQKFPKWELISK